MTNTSNANTGADTKVQYLSPEGAIAPTGTWTVGSRAGDYVFVAGMRGIDPVTNTLVEGDQARVMQGFRNMELIAASEGARLQDAVRLTVYVTDMDKPPPGEQGPGGTLGGRAVSAAHHSGSRLAQSG